MPTCDCYDWNKRARAHLHWLSTTHSAWLHHDGQHAWTGWHAGTAGPIVAQPPSDGWRPWSAECDASEAPYVRWFINALTSAAFNELDRHVLQVRCSHTHERHRNNNNSASDVSLALPPLSPQEHGHEAAIFSEVLDAAPSAIERRELLLLSALAASALSDELELPADARLACYLPNEPLAVVWMAAAKRLGVAYVAVAGGTVAASLASRLDDTLAAAVVTSTDLLPAVEAALAQLQSAFSTPPLVIVASSSAASGGAAASGSAGGAAGPSGAPSAPPQPTLPSSAYHDAAALLDRARARLLQRLSPALAHLMVAQAQQPQQPHQPSADFVAALWRLSAPTPVDASHPLFILYTSGSTGKPKGIVHTHGGYLVGLASSCEVVFDLKAARDALFVVATPGWITGQSYVTN